MATSVKTFEHFSLHPGVSCKGWLLYFIIKDALVRFIHPSLFNAEMMSEIWLILGVFVYVPTNMSYQ